ncbi:methylated-DNA--[protein]-cysteine S-methyltransferase [Psittacicella gerlachiana]|uniref:methylated-DNA--[protein]-cysteine S-methyltransferase n=1 Tax=Psittacicella gerlachiana TaxID=2028574 RepID=A0A3A1YCW2_9GAMM|nr:methylated-DNA--[protein]-cysteine S-methyltransferase [Psittacicella gerlachiana]RIY35000.1 hypothetical protein CKF59_04275 [Psittacicella gerlachiana]
MKQTQEEPGLVLAKTLFAFKREQELTYEFISTPLGQMLALFSRQGLCWLQFWQGEGVAKIQALASSFAISLLPQATTEGIRLTRELEQYFARKREEFTIALDLVGTPWQLKVWASLQAIPYGQTISYLQQAQDLQQRQAVRAIAQANSKNPIAILIPCHRVIRNNGELGGYYGGVERKKWLLALEQRERQE